MSKVWDQLNIAGIDKKSLEAVAEQLEQLGAVSITFTDQNDDAPIYEPALNTTPLWQQTVLTALFDNKQLMQLSHSWLNENYAEASVTVETLADRAWEREWLKSFKPMCFGEKLWICPSHHQPIEPDAVNVILDPGLAFGTGTHPTTALCLSYLDGCQLADKTVCDYGTGSGILAISALKLGAAKAYAVDIDPQAIIATQQNAKVNGISQSCLTVDLVDKLAIPSVDLLLANILAGPLIELAPQLVAKVCTGGTLVISGLLQEQLEAIEQVYSPLVQSFSYQSKEDWLMCVMQC